MPIVDGHIRCGRCREFKELSEFAPSCAAKGCGECRSCANARSRAYARTPRGRERQKEWRAQNIEAVRARGLAKYHQAKPSGRPENTRLKTRYGITLAEFEAMFVSQGGKCACCGDVVGDLDSRGRRKLYVDHCHTTGVVRGLLCANCNSGIGQFKDSTERLRGAIAYLERAQQPLSRVEPTMRINLMRGAN